MTHINHLPADDASLIKTEFDYHDPKTWPDTSYAANERDLAYMLDDDTMEYYNTAIEYTDADQENEQHSVSFDLFLLLMMHKAAFLAMIDLHGNDIADALQLRLQVQADANENSGEYFHTAMQARLAHWKNLHNIAASFNKEN